MQCTTAKVTQIMMCRFTGENSDVDCSIMPTQTVSDTSKMQVTIEEAQEAES